MTKETAAFSFTLMALLKYNNKVSFYIRTLRTNMYGQFSWFLFYSQFYSRMFYGFHKIEYYLR